MDSAVESLESLINILLGFAMNFWTHSRYSGFSGVGAQAKDADPRVQTVPWLLGITSSHLEARPGPAPSAHRPVCQQVDTLPHSCLSWKPGPGFPHTHMRQNVLRRAAWRWVPSWATGAGEVVDSLWVHLLCPAALFNIRFWILNWIK